MQTSVGTVTATNSTISGNDVQNVNAEGGGIHTVGGTIVIDKSTVTNNTMRSTRVAGAGISMDPDNGSLNESLTIHNSILAGNTNFDKTIDFVAPAGTSAFTVTNSLIGDNLGTTLAEAQTEDSNGNLVGSSTNPIDPMLGQLADNGGPTETHDLLAGSPALDAGDPSMTAAAGATDQRGPGFERVSNGRVDIGAVERDQITVNDNSSDTDDGDPNNGMTTLREAVNLANANDHHTLITFDPSLSGQSIDLVASLEINKSVDIDGTALDSDVTIDAQGFSRILYSNTTEETNLTIAGLTFTGGQTTGNGGAIFFDTLGTLTITDSTITGNEAVGNGGGIYSRADMELTRSTVSNNRSHANGGGLFMRSHTQTIIDSTISDNVADLDGGGTYSSSGRHDVTGSTISGNTATNGGGLFGYGTIRYIQSTTISGNVAEMDGGGIHCNFITGLGFSTVTGNTAGGQAGGFYNGGPTVQLDSTIVSGNDANGLPNNLHGYFIANGDNLLGDGDVPSGSNITGVNDPMLGPLADNGGPTLTHAPLPGSPVIDAGNPAFVPGVFSTPEFDQRGAPYVRLTGTAVDIGAVELQSTPVTCDFDGDSVCDGQDIDQLVAQIASGNHDLLFDLTGDALVDLDDRDAWLAAAGAMNLPSGNAYILGDANLDGAVDVSDFNIWNSNKFTFVDSWTLA
ncbi:MAG: choice-of-anchor Q domain-containing protein, partial [Planctomycetota bacterium]